MGVIRPSVISRDVAAVCKLAVILTGVVAIAGCSTTPTRLASHPEGDRATWFAASSGSHLESYEPLYEQTGGEADAAQAEALNRHGAQAEAGDPAAAYEVGKAYRYGYGVPANTERAARWFMEAVSRPHGHWPHAAYQLGTMFLAGEGVSQDTDLAQRLLLEAARLGYARAALPLAQLYAEGRDVAIDLPRARRLALSSAESGDAESYLWLLRAYRANGVFGQDAPQSERLGAQLSSLLRERSGDARALRDLALIYYQGLGVPPDRAEALRLLDRAAQLKRPDYLAQFGEDLAKGRNGFAADPPQGFRMMREAAERYANADAMSMVAEAYESGLGVQRDPAAAEQWFGRAIQAGSTRAAVAYGRLLVARENDPPAQRRGVDLLENAAAQLAPAAWVSLGELHLDDAIAGADSAQGIAYLERAHLAGIPAATTRLGEAYLEGRGVPRDPDRAVALLNGAAAAGQVRAMLALGKGYYEGDALPRQPDLAAQWLQEASAAGSDEAYLLLGRGLLAGDLPGGAAEGMRIVASFAQSDDVEAMMMLGRAMRDGKTVPRDREAARRWFANAERAGHPEAKAELAALLYQEGSRRLDLAQLEEAAELGHPGAMARLGRAHLLGEGTSADPFSGSLWLQRAADAGSASAAHLLGSAYLRGTYGLNRDPVQAQRLLGLAAAAGNAHAERDLGYALIRPGGSGLRPDPQRGLRLLTLAAEKGDGRAMELLGRVYLEGGKGVPPQPDTAEIWLTQAAEKGFGSVPTTPQAASLDAAAETDSPQDIRTLRDAAAAGDEAARVRLGTLYLFGSELVQAQPLEGEALLQPAVRNGDTAAMLALGLAYLHGSFGERRIDQGTRLLFDAARAGNTTARTVLAKAVLHARGAGRHDGAEAGTWLDAQLTGDRDEGVAALTAMLQQGLSNAPLSAAPAIEDEAAAR